MESVNLNGIQNLIQMNHEKFEKEISRIPVKNNRKKKDMQKLDKQSQGLTNHFMLDNLPNDTPVNCNKLHEKLFSKNHPVALGDINSNSVDDERSSIAKILLTYLSNIVLVELDVYSELQMSLLTQILANMKLAGILSDANMKQVADTYDKACDAAVVDIVGESVSAGFAVVGAGFSFASDLKEHTLDMSLNKLDKVEQDLAVTKVELTPEEKTYVQKVENTCPTKFKTEIEKSNELEAKIEEDSDELVKSLEKKKLSVEEYSKEVDKFYDSRIHEFSEAKLIRNPDSQVLKFADVTETTPDVLKIKFSYKIGDAATTVNLDAMAVERQVNDDVYTYKCKNANNDDCILTIDKSSQGAIKSKIKIGIREEVDITEPMVEYTDFNNTHKLNAEPKHTSFDDRFKLHDEINGSYYLKLKQRECLGNLSSKLSKTLSRKESFGKPMGITGLKINEVEIDARYGVKASRNIGVLLNALSQSLNGMSRGVSGIYQADAQKATAMQQATSNAKDNLQSSLSGIADETLKTMDKITEQMLSTMQTILQVSGSLVYS